MLIAVETAYNEHGENGEPSSIARSDHARGIIDAVFDVAGNNYAHPITELVENLMHMSHHMGIDFNEIMKMARKQFAESTKGGKQ
jgi:hypothetical protein